MSKRGESAAKWRAMIQEHRASGMPVMQFCRDRGVPPSSFFAWRRRLRQEPPRRSSPAFIEVNARTPAAREEVSRSTLELLLPGGHRLLVRSGFDPQVLRELLRTLERLA